MKCRKNVEEDEENAMKMNDDFREFGCLICVRSEKMNVNDLYICEVTNDVMNHNDSSLKICTFCGKT